MTNYLIVGLGNIGIEYMFTRHNIGFMALDEMAKELELKFTEVRYGSMTQFRYKGKNIYLLKPNTFMNRSGKAVDYWIKNLKVPLENLLILVDDLALPLETLRAKPKGSAGGHNGLKSIEETLNTNQYNRLRMGIGDNFHKGNQVNYVLGKFSEPEMEKMNGILTRTQEIIIHFCLEGIDKTMNKFNQ